MYCEKADLVAEFGATKVNAWAQNDDARITSACEAAAATVDGYLSSGGYATPIEVVPTLITQLSVDIAAYRLLSSKGHLGSDRDPGAEALANRQKAAVRYLEGVARGTLKVDGVSRPVSAGTPGGRGGMQVSKPLPPLDMSGYLE